MVKINKTLKKDVITTIKINIKRYISLIAIIFLGVSFFIGMKSNAPVLQSTVSEFLEDNNYMDIEILSEIGITNEEMQLLKDNIKEIKTIEGGYYEEVIITSKNKDTNKEIESVIALHSYSANKKLNKLEISQGKDITGTYECIVDESLSKYYALGDTITINSDNLKTKEFKIVAFAKSPEYISADKGSSSLLSGKIEYFIYIPEDAFSITDYPNTYTLAYIKLDTNYEAFSTEYNDYVKKIKAKIISLSQNISKERLNKIISEKSQLLQDKKDEYNNTKNEVENNLLTAKEKLDTLEEQVSDADSKVLSDNEVDIYLSSLKSDLDIAKSQLDSSRATLDMAKELLNVMNSSNNKENVNFDLTYLENKLSKLQNEVDNLNSLATTYKKQLKENEEKCEQLTYESLKESCYDISFELQNKLESINSELNNVNKEIDEINIIISYIKSFKGVNTGYDSATIEEYRIYIDDLETKYSAESLKYNSLLKDYESAKINLKEEMKKAREEISKQKEELEKAQEEYKNKEKELMVSLEQMEKELANVEKLLNKIKKSDWNIFTRNDSYGYSQYYDDIQRINNLGKIIPIFFFLVAILVTVSTITRMVIEERRKIGILVSLGYNNNQIRYKYIYYTFTAMLIGTLFGVLFGALVFPRIFKTVFSLLYFIPKIKFVLYFKYILPALFLSFSSTVIVGVLIVNNTLKEKPHALMGLKSKTKIVSEKNRKFWKKLPFLKKITYKNILSGTARSIMTIIGIAGCTALIIACFGTREAISKIIYIQYEELFNVSGEYFYKDNLTDYEIREEQNRINSLEKIDKAILTRVEMVDFKKGDKTYSVYNIIPDNTLELEQVINFYNVNSNENISLDDSGVILSEKIAHIIDANVGDTITYIDSYNLSHQVKVAAITENYIFHYMYMSKNLYEEVNNYSFENNTLFVKFNEEDEEEVNNLIYQNNMFSSYQSLKDARDSYDMVMDNFDKIILVTTVSAGILAFVVLYNLAKINISERTREIATLKVLGYNNKEIYNFINSEMNLLTILGIVLGIIMGHFLADIVITTCEIDNLMYYHKISVINYIYGVVLTLIFSRIITMIVKKDLKKVSMVESLKLNE